MRCTCRTSIGANRWSCIRKVAEVARCALAWTSTRIRSSGANSHTWQPFRGSNVTSWGDSARYLAFIWSVVPQSTIDTKRRSFFRILHHQKDFVRHGEWKINTEDDFQNLHKENSIETVTSNMILGYHITNLAFRAVKTIEAIKVWACIAPIIAFGWACVTGGASGAAYTRSWARVRSISSARAVDASLKQMRGKIWLRFDDITR